MVATIIGVGGMLATQADAQNVQPAAYETWTLPNGGDAEDDFHLFHTEYEYYDNFVLDLGKFPQGSVVIDIQTTTDADIYSLGFEALRALHRLLCPQRGRAVHHLRGRQFPRGVGGYPESLHLRSLRSLLPPVLGVSAVGALQLLERGGHG